MHLSERIESHITERRCRIGVHNGWTYLREPSTATLTPDPSNRLRMTFQGILELQVPKSTDIAVVFTVSGLAAMFMR